MAEVGTKNDNFVRTLSGYCAPEAGIKANLAQDCASFVLGGQRWALRVDQFGQGVVFLLCFFGRDGAKSESYFRELNCFYTWGAEAGAKNETVLQCIQFLLILTGRGGHQKRINLTDL